MNRHQLTIGQVSSKTGCKIPTIRYYEEIGLLTEATRTEGGHRVYGEDDVRRLVFIRHGRDLGFSLDTIRSLSELASNKDQSCAEVDVLASAHLEEVEEKLRLLSAMREALQELLDQCRQTTILECRVIEALSSDPSDAA